MGPPTNSIPQILINTDFLVMTPTTKCTIFYFFLVEKEYYFLVLHKVISNNLGFHREITIARTSTIRIKSNNLGYVENYFVEFGKQILFRMCLQPYNLLYMTSFNDKN